jgi:3',5'-cyclic AMP phosphodiesterase CpdA
VSLNILHLSDLHFGEKHCWGKNGFPLLEYSISNELAKHPDIHTDVIVVTGDISSNGTSDDFHDAKKFFKNIIDNNVFKSLKKIIIVPGNHDYRWRSSNNKKLTSLSERSEHFNAFINDLSSNNTDLFDLADTNLDAKILNILNKNYVTWSFVSHNDLCCLFLGMNSVIIDSENDQGIGYFGNEQLNAIAELVLKYKQLKQEEIVIIPIFHHHILPVAYTERDYFFETDGVRSKKCSVTLDAKAALEVFHKIGCKLVLHGHQHQPAFSQFRNQLHKSMGHINVAASGSVGASVEDLGDIRQNHFYCYKLSRSSLEVLSFQTSKDDNTVYSFDSSVKLDMNWEDNVANDDNCSLAYMIPSDARKVTFNSGVKNSGLFFLFLNLLDCKIARSEINTFIKRDYLSDIEMVSEYDLYGRYDSIIKFREKQPGKGNVFITNVIDYLNEIKQLRNTDESGYRYVQASKECYNINDPLSNKIVERTLYLLPDDKSYQDSNRSLAFLLVELSGTYGSLSAEVLIRRLLDNISNKENDNEILEIIKGIHFMHNQCIIFEIQMSCRQFWCLNRLSEIIEKIIDAKGINKTTHIAYSHKVHFS